MTRATIKYGLLSTVLAVGLALLAGVSPAHAGGSDSPTPYTVNGEGITLPAGSVFVDGGHVNIKTAAGGNVQTNIHFEARCIERVDAECAGARHDSAQYIGKSSIPWSAFGLECGDSVSWVQISGFNEHHGEGGQSPVMVACPPVVMPPAPADPNASIAAECGKATVTLTNPRGANPEQVTASFVVYVDGEFSSAHTVFAGESEAVDLTFAEDAGSHSIVVRSGPARGDVLLAEATVESDCLEPPVVTPPTETAAPLPPGLPTTLVTAGPFEDFVRIIIAVALLFLVGGFLLFVRLMSRNHAPRHRAGKFSEND